MRAIDGDAVLDRYYAEFEKQDICDGSQDKDWLMRCIKEAPTLAQPNEWVIVGERLPEKKRDVLMLFGAGNMAVGWLYDIDEHTTFWCAYTDDGFYTDCDCAPTHWMMLPKPPKGSGDVAFSATTESGCEYCSGDPMKPLDWQYGLDHIFPDYKYCPMCGRRVQK